MQEEQKKHKQYRQSLGDQVNTVEQEARMVLPGMQALFGFQLIAVFNQGFRQELAYPEQVIHLIALLLVAIAVMLVVAPAAYHRQAHHQISEHFVSLSSKYIAAGMVPLAIGVCLDIYAVANVILRSRSWSAVIAGILFLIYSWTWFIFPKVKGREIRKVPANEPPAGT